MPRRDVLTTTTNVFAIPWHMVDDDAAITMLATLLHDHRVATRGYWGTGEDAGCRSGLQGRANRPGGNTLTDGQTDAGLRHISQSNRVTIHGRIIERRHVDRRKLGFGQYPTQRRGNRHMTDFFDRLNGSQQLFQRLFVTEHGQSLLIQ